MITWPGKGLALVSEDGMGIEEYKALLVPLEEAEAGEEEIFFHMPNKHRGITLSLISQQK